MHVLMGSVHKEPVGLLLQLEKPMFDNNVRQFHRISDEDSEPEAIGVPARERGIGGTSNDADEPAPAEAAGDCEYVAGENGSEEGVHSEGEELLMVSFNRPGAPSLIAKDSNTLTLQWDACYPKEEGGTVQLAVEYSVEIQQVEVPSGRTTPDEEAATGLLKTELWKRVTMGTDAWTQIRGLKPGRYYAIRVLATPICDNTSVQLERPESSPVVVFHTTPSVPVAPQPPQLRSREKKTLKFKWNVPETGGLDILEYRLQINPPPANMQNKENAEGFTEVYAGPDQSYRVLKLQPGSKYAVRVKARNELGEGPWSLNSVFTTLAAVPSTPEPPQSTSITSTSIALQWPAAKEHGAKVDSYTVEGEDPDSGLFLPLYNGSQTHCVLEGLKSGALYKFKVRAESQVGKTAWSHPTTVRTAASFPGSPPTPSVTDLTKTSARLSWTSPKETGGSEIINYRGELMPISKAACKSMAREWTAIYTGPETSCTVDNLRSGCVYQFRVRATNGVGAGSPSQFANIKTASSTPEEPASPGVTSRDSTHLRVAWKLPEHDGGSQITEYQLQCSESREFTAEGTTSFDTVYQGKQLCHEVADLVPGVEYVFRVRASNNCGWSSWSSVWKATTRAGMPARPLPPVVQESTSYSLTVVWSAPDCQGSPITGYTVQLSGRGSCLDDRSANPYPRNGSVPSESAKQSTDVSTSGTDVETMDAVALEGRASSQPNGQDTSTIVFEDVYVGSNTTCRIPNLQPYCNYTFRLKASNKAGSSEWSQEATYRTEAAVPSAPRNLQAEGVSTDAVQLCWEPPSSANGSKVTTFVLERFSQRSKKQCWVQECQVPDMSCKVAELRAGREYQFRIRAGNRCGFGPPGEPFTVRTAAAAPGPPEAPFFAQKTATTIRVKWGPPDKENGAPVKQYRLEVVEQGGAFMEVYSGYATAHKVTGLLPGQQYVFRVQAVNEAGRGEWSNTAPVVMALAPPPRPLNVVVNSHFDDGSEAAVQGDVTMLEVDWDDVEVKDPNCTAAASFEVEACPCKDRGSQIRPSTVRQVVVQPPCRLVGLPADTCFAVRVRVVGAQSAGHSKWSDTVLVTTPGWKKIRPSTPSESNSSGNLIAPSPRSSRSATSIMSEDSLPSARSTSRSVKKTQMRRPRPRKSLWKTMKPYFTTSIFVAVFVLFCLLLRGNFG